MYTRMRAVRVRLRCEFVHLTVYVHVHVDVRLECRKFGVRQNEVLNKLTSGLAKPKQN